MLPREKRRGGILTATVATIVAMAILVGLGIWQLDRKVWKESLIATVTTRASRAPEPLPPRLNWERLLPEGTEYSRVAFSAEFLDGQEAYAYTAGSSLRADVEGQGFWVFAPARLAGGSIVLIIAASCRPTARTRRRARKARRAAASISSAICAGRRRAACSRRPTT